MRAFVEMQRKGLEVRERWRTTWVLMYQSTASDSMVLYENVDAFNCSAGIIAMEVAWGKPLFLKKPESVVFRSKLKVTPLLFMAGLFYVFAC